MTDNTNNEQTSEGKNTIEQLAEINNKLSTYLGKDYDLRKSFLKQKRFRTILFALVFGIPSIVYMLMFTGLIKTQTIDGDYVALVRISGEIAAEKAASANNLVPVIKRACDDAGAIGLVLHINSPGGSPVQASEIYNMIQKCRDVNNKKVIAVGQDAMTSGAYWIASAADEIYVNKSTVTGSIGVKTEGFGLDLKKYLEKYGVERRVMTAGDNKVRMDMFEPLTEKDKQKTTELLAELHGHFKEAVLANRNERIVVDHRIAFSGDYWSGATAKEMGLVDDIADLSEVINYVYKASSVLDYTPKPGMFQNLKSTFSIQSLVHGLFSEVKTTTVPSYVAM